MKGLHIAFFSVLLLSFGYASMPVASQSEQQNLLEKVKQQRSQEKQRMAQREARFLAEKQEQSRLLAEARTEFETFQKENNPLKQQTEKNAQKIAELQAKIQRRQNELGDFGSVLNQMTRDFADALNASPVSMQINDRSATLAQLSNDQNNLNLQRMESLWFVVQEEMTLAAQFHAIEAPVVQPDGEVLNQSLVQFGGFSSYQNGQFLRYVSETQEFLLLPELSSQSQNNQQFFAAQSGFHTLYVDTTGGSLLGMLEWTPGWRERLEQGGIIGKIILALGALGLLIILWRVLALGWQNHVMKRQLKQLQQPKTNNALGRILTQVKDKATGINLNEHSQLDMLQLQVDEAVLNEIGGIERGQNLLKLLAATAPLLGLLGTVTGMIVTFQSISFFGSGDPKLMAGGISQALVTTVLGLIVAIPLLFGHSFISSLAENIIRRLEEQTAGLLVQLLEENQIIQTQQQPYAPQQSLVRQ